MESNTFLLDVDIKQDNYINTPIIKQNDSVVFIINLTDAGEPIDLTGVTRYTIATERGDGIGVIADGKKTGESQVTFNLPRESTTRTGRATHTVQLYSADERVSSFTFPMMVEKDPSASLIVTGGDKTLIEIVLGEGPRVIQEAKDATITANDAATLAGTKGDYAQQQGDYAKAEGAKATASALAADTATGKANTAATEADAAKDRANISADTADVATGKANTAAANADASAGRADTSATKADTAATGLDAIKADTVAATGDALAAAELANTESSGLATMKADVVAATASATNASTQATTQADYAKTQGDYAKAQGDAVQEIFDSGLVASVNGQTGAVVLTSEEIADTPTKRFVTDVKTAEWDGKETLEGSQAKVNALAGAGNTKTVKQLDDEIAGVKTEAASHSADKASHIQAGERENWNAKATPEDVRLLIEQTTYSVTKSAPDADGTFTTIEYKRKSDGSLATKSVLSGGTAPKYTTRTITYYGTDGLPTGKVDVFTLSYNADGALIGEV